MNHRVPFHIPKKTPQTPHQKYQKKTWGIPLYFPSPWMTCSLPGSASFFVIHQASLINHIHKGLCRWNRWNLSTSLVVKSPFKIHDLFQLLTLVDQWPSCWLKVFDQSTIIFSQQLLTSGWCWLKVLIGHEQNNSGPPRLSCARRKRRPRRPLNDA